ncbi:hypothetical protein EDD99_4039 [Streptomyces sp. 846.5]|nr:hypothetical protein [Streptomyces sp. 846.5]TDU05523.1 hypothetical protein EDD99_4039 [Streptomyces sp. 846.5]
MALTGLDPARASRLSALTAELRLLLAADAEMPTIQEILSARGVGVMDSIVVTYCIQLRSARIALLGAVATNDPDRMRRGRSS